MDIDSRRATPSDFNTGTRGQNSRTDAPNSNRLYEEWLESLSHLRESDFSAHDVAKQLKIAERTARYFLKWAIEANLLMRVGSGRGIRYRFSQIDCPA